MKIVRKMVPEKTIGASPFGVNVGNSHLTRALYPRKDIGSLTAALQPEFVRLKDLGLGG